MVFLLSLRARGQAKTGQYFGEPVTFLGVVRDWLTDPAVRADQVIMVFLTVLLLLSIATFAPFEGLQHQPGAELLPP